MGTQDPLVHIEAATLAGGENNQDRYAYGDGWAFVLDGASSFSEAPLVHDGGWYAQRLKEALTKELTCNPAMATTDILARAIQGASADHDELVQGPCPTSTISMARWKYDVIELYVLGDSFASVTSPTSQLSALLEDSRIEEVARGARDEYRRRLNNGNGFDQRHGQLLAELQAAQQEVRNRPGGYWIMGSDVQAPNYGIMESVPLRECNVLLFSDGLTATQYPAEAAQALAAAPNLGVYLDQLNSVEEMDIDATHFPRSKPHDDKTAVRVNFRRTARVAKASSIVPLGAA